jgi:hypothetical protein
MFPERFLKAQSFAGKHVTLVISDLYLDDLPKGDKDDEPDSAKQETEEHTLLCFRKTKKELRLNKTNGYALREMFGDDPTAWIGHAVTLYPTKAWFGREQVDAVRVWGSPELKEDLVFTLRLPRRKPQRVTLHAVRKGQQQAPEQDPPEEPQGDPYPERDQPMPGDPYQGQEEPGANG